MEDALVSAKNRKSMIENIIKIFNFPIISIPYPKDIGHGSNDFGLLNCAILL